MTRKSGHVVTNLGAAVVDLRLRALDAVQRILQFDDRAVQLLKGDPGIPDRLRPVEILHCDVPEDLARVVVEVLPTGK